MPRSPPLFICSSPGPDPYRSHDNVYEELEHPTASPGPVSGGPISSGGPLAPDSEDEDDDVRVGPVGVGTGGRGGATIHSDDDFAEDELSLPGDRSFHKVVADGATTVATIYHDVGTASSSGGELERNRMERNSLLSSSSNDAGAGGANRNSSSSGGECASSSSGNGNSKVGGSGSIGSLFRSRKQASSTLGSGRNKKSHCVVPADPPCEMGMTPMAYDERAMMTLPPSYQVTNGHPHHHPHHLNSINNNNNFVNNSNSLNNNHVSSRSNYYSTIDDREEEEVERRNRINAQLSASAAVITPGAIFRGAQRPPYNGHHHPAQQSNSRSRTNPRSLDRRRYLNNTNNNNNHSPASTPLSVISAPQPQDPSQYIYHEPVFHEGLIYDGCLSYSDRSSGGSTGGPPYPYVLPPFTTFRNGGGGTGGPNSNQAIYSRDSSFGSDSGYSQHTQASNRSGSGWSRNHRPPHPSSSSLQRPPACDPVGAVVQRGGQTAVDS